MIAFGSTLERAYCRESDALGHRILNCSGHQAETIRNAPALDNIHSNSKFQAPLAERRHSNGKKTRNPKKEIILMPIPKVPVCTDTPVLRAGQKFEWTNSHDVDCLVTHCQPPLECPSYLVPKHGIAVAQVDQQAVPNPPNHYPYVGDCCGGKPQPKIIIGP